MRVEADDRGRSELQICIAAPTGSTRVQAIIALKFVSRRADFGSREAAVAIGSEVMFSWKNNNESTLAHNMSLSR